MGGFTLIELVVTVVVLAIMSAVAIPSFISVMNGNRISSASHELVAGLQLARSEAIRTNRSASLCFSTDGLACANTAMPTSILVMNDDGLVRSTALNPNIVMTVSPSLQANMAAAGRPVVTFRADGRAYTGAGTLLNGVIGACMATKRPADNIRNVTISAGGRIGTKTGGTGDGLCAAPANKID